MISVSEAKKIITENIVQLPARELNLLSAAGHTLAADAIAIMDVPPFNQSAMDGYAFRFEDRHRRLTVSGELAAGAASAPVLRAGEAVRVFTGAPVPEGCDTVIMQEKVTVQGNSITLSTEGMVTGANIRKKGGEMMKGDVAIPSRTMLTPAALGLLASVGLQNVQVLPFPSVTLIVTGSELVAPGQPLSGGQVYESNSITLTAALARAGIKTILVQHSNDDPLNLRNLLSAALDNSDMILFTGGVSVGDYDFVIGATKACSVKQLFHKVKQRPGKPLYFGMAKNKPVFGLPGNPSSVLTCFYEYVMPAIEQMRGSGEGLPVVQALLETRWQKAAGLTHFLKARYVDGRVRVLDAQESYRMSSFAIANCFVVLPEHETDFHEGQQVSVHLYP